jgi:hypothetical protein
MEVVIHGTKGGYRILFKTPGAPSIGSDIRNNVSSEAAIGRSAYSIAFATNGYIFTKYLIIRDSLRSDATGFIAFSLFLSFNKELQNKGADVKSILDELSKHYVDNYIRNNSINNGETDIIQEDWSFVAKILVGKKEQSNSQINIETLSGSKEASIIYYEDDFKLQEYFSKPFQEEYNDYKQIYFLNGELRNRSSDLLNALRNSGVELNVDLKNEYFYLNNYDPSRGLTINANIKHCSNSTKSYVIRAKEILNIKYVKEYFRPIEEAGTLFNTASDIYKYLDRNGNQIAINYDALAKAILEPIVKTITFYITDWKGNPINDANIIYKSNKSHETFVNSCQIRFTGEDLGNRWTVSANNNRLSSEERVINFEKDCSGDTGSVEIKLNKHELKITVQDSITKVEKEDYNINKRYFYDSEIEKTHSIIVEMLGYESYRFDYHPLETKITQPILLKRKESSYIPKTQNSNDKKAGDNVNNKDKEDDILNEKYKKRLLIGILVGLLIVGLLTVGLLIFNLKNDLYNFLNINEIPKRDKNEQPNQNIDTYIQSYIEGNSLILDTLYEFKKNHSEISTNVSQSLDNAIKIREFIDSLKFSEIRKQYYYPNQKKFESAIRNIDTSKYNLVRKKLVKVSSLRLDEIADSINNILKVSNISKEGGTDEVKKSKDENGKTNNINEIQSPTTKQKEITTPKNHNISSNAGNANNNSVVSNSENIESDIALKLKSNTVTKEILREWKPNVKDEYKKSINLYLEFWNLVLDGTIQKDAIDKLREKVKKDPVLKSSKLNDFLDLICKDNKTFDSYQNKINKVPKNPTLTLGKLKNELSTN